MVYANGKLSEEEVENYIIRCVPFDWIVVADHNVDLIATLGVSHLPVVIVFSDDGSVLYRRYSGSISSEEWASLF